MGCGDGELLRQLIDTHHITGRGVELSETGVLACVQKGLSVRQGNIQEGLKDYPAQSFNSVILSQTLPYLDNPTFIIQEMLRVGERAIISFPNWGHWRCRLAFLLTGYTQSPPGLAIPWYTVPRPRPITVRDFSKFCQQNGFKINQQIYFQGDKSIPARRDKNLRATVAIFELK